MAWKLGRAKWDIVTTTRFSTGALYDAASTPTGTVYKNGTADALAVTVTNITTGIYKWTCTPSVGAGFAAGDSVSVVITGTVDSVAMGGTVWSDYLTTNDIDSTPEVDVTYWNGTAVATPATNGYPVVTMKVGTGTGEINLSSGKAPATIAAGDLAADSITASALKADAATEIATAVLAATADGIATSTILQEIDGWIRGKKTVTRYDTYTDVQIYARDGTTEIIHNRIADTGNTPQSL